MEAIAGVIVAAVAILGLIGGIILWIKKPLEDRSDRQDKRADGIEERIEKVDSTVKVTEKDVVKVTGRVTALEKADERHEDAIGKLFDKTDKCE